MGLSDPPKGCGNPHRQDGPCTSTGAAHASSSLNLSAKCQAEPSCSTASAPRTCCVWQAQPWNLPPLPSQSLTPAAVQQAPQKPATRRGMPRPQQGGRAGTLSSCGASWRMRQPPQGGDRSAGARQYVAPCLWGLTMPGRLPETVPALGPRTARCPPLCLPPASRPSTSGSAGVPSQAVVVLCWFACMARPSACCLLRPWGPQLSAGCSLLSQLRYGTRRVAGAVLLERCLHVQCWSILVDCQSCAQLAAQVWQASGCQASLTPLWA